MYIACMINKIAISKCLSLTTQTLLFLATNVSLGYFQLSVIRDSIHDTKQSSSAHSRIQVVYCKIHTHFTVLFCTILYYTVLYCTILYYTVLYCTIPYYTLLYCTIPYYTVLYCQLL